MSGTLHSCETIDYHTAGEPFRIVPNPPVTIAGESVADKRAAALPCTAVDDLRRLLCHEPRGHADMYGGFLTRPDDEGADFGVLFWHTDGFSTACGHGTIALGTWALESGLVAPDPSGLTEVVIDVPSGRVRADVHTDPDGRVTAVDFVNVASRLVARNIVARDFGPSHVGPSRIDSAAVPVSPDHRTPLEVDLAWGGAFYALIDGDRHGLTVAPDHLGELIRLDRTIKDALVGHPLTTHPTDDRLSGVYGTIVVNRCGTTADGDLLQRNVTVFADGQVDRSPCGSGTAARVAALWASGELGPGQTLIHESIIGTRFRARVLAEVAGPAVESNPRPDAPAVIPVITGSAHRVAASTFTVDPADDLSPGFVLRH